MAWFVLRPRAPYNFTMHLERFSVGGPMPWVYEGGCLRVLLPVGGVLEPVRACFSGEPWEPVIRLWARREEAVGVFRDYARAGLDWSLFLERLEGYPRVRSIALEYAGVRPGRCQSLYYALVDSIVRQRVPLRVASRTVSRLVSRYGARMVVDGLDYYSYPPAIVLSRVPLEELRGLGLSRLKARGLREAAMAELEGRLPSVGEAVRDPQGVIRDLTGLYGVGRWTAGLAVAMVHPLFPVWPFGDLAVERGLRLALPNMSTSAVRSLVEGLGDYAGLLMYVLSLYYEDSKRRGRKGLA